MIEDIINRDYLAEMRQGVGDDVFVSLVAQAADNLVTPLAEMTAAWRHGNDSAFRDAAHRLKGAASSIGCVSLASATHDVMTDDRLVEQMSGAEIQALQQLLAVSLQALARFTTHAS